MKRALKRGALIAAANWPVTLIQASADSLFKLLLAAPLIGGVFLIGLAMNREPSMLLLLGTRELVGAVASALWAQPVVLTTLGLAITVVGVGGSLFVFLIKAGTIATLVRSDRDAGAIEEPPLHMSAVARASRFGVEEYIESARELFPRYMRLGFGLMAVYLASATGFWMLVAGQDPGRGWGGTALATAAFVLWITVVNWLYLLVQIVVAADACGVATAIRRVAAFLRCERRHVATVFLLVLAAVAAATGASLLATAALGLVAFVPFVGLAALPLQLLAWLLRGLVFQYLGLASVGAYLKLYRAFADARGRLRPAAAYGQAWGPAS
ncbi:MAG: hypothetical protein A3H29_04240 [Acidobacteria bacterium RIFCSPLOWO2_02_FULL_67_21]|nr:MAG: hypothetical protein A3H29_04240 [Acidobacteria bacterium RIFCSPLOWO2_02_FULL_67_21]